MIKHLVPILRFLSSLDLLTAGNTMEDTGQDILRGREKLEN